MYIENPKTKGSGIVCAIPQTGTCPNKCPDCFFQSGRSYLEPLEDNLPNLPTPEFADNRVVRVNDGNDSNVDRLVVYKSVDAYDNFFFNTISIDDLEGYDAPVVLTINPGHMTDNSFHRIEDPPTNLMFVRFRTNTWNLAVCEQAVDWYGDREVPIILTFMAYHKEESIPTHQRHNYFYRKRTINPYYVIDTRAWKRVMDEYWTNKWVYSCGREGISSGCKDCGNCLREYYATMERIREVGNE